MTLKTFFFLFCFDEKETIPNGCGNHSVKDQSSYQGKVNSVSRYGFIESVIQQQNFVIQT